MKHQHYGTEERQRNKVIPGTMIKHHGRIYRASANVEKVFMFIQ